MARQIVDAHDLAVAVAVVAGDELPLAPPRELRKSRPSVRGGGRLPRGTMQMLRAITATVEPLEAAEAACVRLAKERADLYARGRDLGIPSRVMAEAAGITEQAVGKAIKNREQ